METAVEPSPAEGVGGSVINRRGTIFFVSFRSNRLRVDRSRNSGSTWTNVLDDASTINDSRACCIAVDSSDNLHVFSNRVAGATFRHYRSTDEGGSWSTGDRTFVGSDLIGCGSSVAGKIFGGVAGNAGGTRFLWSFNQAYTWDNVLAGFTTYALDWGMATPPQAMTVEPFTFKAILCVEGSPTNTYVYESTDSVLTNFALTGNLVSSAGFASTGMLAVDQDSGTVWFAVHTAADHLTVWRRLLGGSFTQVADLTPSSYWDSYSPIYYHNGILYITLCNNDNVTNRLRYYWSSDMGVNWTLVSEADSSIKHWLTGGGMKGYFGSQGIHRQVMFSDTDYPGGAGPAGTYFHSVDRLNVSPGGSWPWNGWRGRGRQAGMV